MRIRLQFAACLLALGLSAALSAPGSAQRGHVNFAQNHPPNSPPKPERQQQRQEHRPPQQEARRPQAQQRQQPEARRPQTQQPRQENANRAPQLNPNRLDAAGGNARANNNPNRIPQPNPNRPAAGGGNPRANNNPNRPPGAYTPPSPHRTFNELSPPEKKRVIENYKKLQSLPPSQRQEITGPRKDTWGTLTPQQQNHIKTEVYPQWKQLPPERRKAITQRLGVLQNMPESARNQHLNDPNFTRGMSEEDKSTLRDLSHMHVGAPPEPPNE